MPFVKVMIHAVWGTKNRFPFLQKTLRPEVYRHITDNAKIKSLYIDCLNGAEDLVHILMGLNADISISKTIQLIKGESSFWINKKSLVKPKFEWADEYYAVSVSESKLDDVRRYINNQGEHHRKKTFQEECNEFMKHYDFAKFQG
jgi:REP element-mobilizing transposase RayT